MNGTTMDVGMLWFDDTPGRALAVIIQGAIDHYTDKYGSPPQRLLRSPQRATRRAISGRADQDSGCYRRPPGPLLAWCGQRCGATTASGSQNLAGVTIAAGSPPKGTRLYMVGTPRRFRAHPAAELVQ